MRPRISFSLWSTMSELSARHQHTHTHTHTDRHTSFTHNPCEPSRAGSTTLININPMYHPHRCPQLAHKHSLRGPAGRPSLALHGICRLIQRQSLRRLNVSDSSRRCCSALAPFLRSSVSNNGVTLKSGSGSFNTEYTNVTDGRTTHDGKNSLVSTNIVDKLL